MEEMITGAGVDKLKAVYVVSILVCCLFNILPKQALDRMNITVLICYIYVKRQSNTLLDDTALLCPKVEPSETFLPRTLSFSFCCFFVVFGAVFIGTLAAPMLQSPEMTVGAAFFGLNLKH